MKIGYGITVQESGDPYISVAEVALDGITQAGIPGAFWVDLFPILKYVPSWFPGAGFKRKAACWKEAINAMADNPFRHVQEQMVQVHFSRTREILLTMILQKNGKATPSVAASLIERLPDEGNPQRAREETIAKNVAFIAYLGTWCTYLILDVPLTSFLPPAGPSQVALKL